MPSRKVFISTIAASLAAGLSGCGLPSLPNNTQTTPPVSILFVEAPPSSMAIDASATIYAVVENSATNSQVNYTVTCGSTGACGAFGASSEAGAKVYTAPSAIPSGKTVTITATAAADTTKSVSATVTITPPLSIAVTLGAMPASLQINAQVTFSATIANDTSANPQVTWAASCGSSECGTLNPTTTASNFGTAYIAPSAIPPNNTVTVTATSVTDPTKSASATIAITPQAPTLANGTYVYQLSGPAGPNANFITGVLVAQNGAITGGEQDSVAYAIDDNGYPYPYAYLSGEIGSGSYATTPDGNLQIAFWVEGGEETLNGVLAPGGKGFIAQLYGSMGSGTLDLQTSTAAPAGGYAFSLNGGNLSSGIPSYAGGILNVDSVGGISGAGSVFDVTGSAMGGTLAPSTVSAPDKFGRVQFVLNPAGSSSLPVQDLIGYIVDSTHIRLISTPTDNSGNYQGVMGGLALGQGANTGKFSSSSIAGASYVFGASSQDGYGINYQIAGVVTANANGALTGTVNWNWLTNSGVQSPLPVNGSWTIDSTGRATFSNLTDPSVTLGSLTNNMYLYLTGDGNGLLISSVYANPFAGQAFQQQTSAFTSASFSRTYGLDASHATTSAIGTVTATAAGNGEDSLAGFADSGNGNSDFAITGSVTASSSGVFTGTLTGLDSASRATANNFTFYLVDNTRAVAIETDNSQLTIGYLELQQ